MGEEEVHKRALGGRKVASQFAAGTDTEEVVHAMHTPVKDPAVMREATQQRTAAPAEALKL